MAEEVADHVERDSALQQVHTLRVSQLMRTYGTVQTRTLASCQDDIFVKDVADSRTGQSLVARVLEKRSEEHTSELQSRLHLVCRLLLEKKKKILCLAVRRSP